MTTTNTTPPKANAAFNALLSTRATLVEALRDIEMQMSKLMTDESLGDTPSPPRDQREDRPSTPTNRYIARDSPWDMATPKTRLGMVQPDQPPATPSVTLTPTTMMNRSAKKRELENESEQGKPPAKPSATTASPSEPIRSAKKVREGNENRPEPAVKSALRCSEKASPSKLDGLARALRSIHWSQYLHSNDESPTLPAAPENNTNEIILLEVRAKPFKVRVGSVATGEPRAWEFTRPGTLKLYQDKVTGHTRIVHRIVSTGVVKVNLGVRGNVVDMEKVLHPKKMGMRFKHCGSVVFFAYESEMGRMVRFRYMLKVQADMVDTLFEKLVEMGATVKNS